MTPTDYCYFDYCQSDKFDYKAKMDILAQGKSLEEEVGEPTCAWWGNLSIEKVYSFNPTAGLSKEAAAHILGAQANVWTEYIPDNAQLEYMIMPRLFAMSEVQWCELKNKDYNKFTEKVKGNGFKMLELLGFNFRNK